MREYTQLYKEIAALLYTGYVMLMRYDRLRLAGSQVPRSATGDSFHDNRAMAWRML
jgi:hypothetical protein